MGFVKEELKEKGYVFICWLYLENYDYEIIGDNCERYVGSYLVFKD